MVEVSTVRRAGLRRWLARDTRRSLIAVLPMVAACFLDPTLYLEPDLTAMAGVLRLWFAMMVLVAVLYVVTTFYAFGRESGERLTALLRASDRARTGWRRYVEFGDGPVAWSLVLSGFSLLCGVVAARMSGPDGDPLLPVLAILLVAGAWATMVSAYAVQYARTDALHGGLVFPGDEERAFLDYVYLSVTVGTAFTTSDVTVTSRRLRRTMIGNSIISFGFSTVVLATVITLL